MDLLGFIQHSLDLLRFGTVDVLIMETSIMDKKTSIPIFIMFRHPVSEIISEIKDEAVKNVIMHVMENLSTELLLSIILVVISISIVFALIFVFIFALIIHKLNESGVQNNHLIFILLNYNNKIFLYYRKYI